MIHTLRTLGITLAATCAGCSLLGQQPYTTTAPKPAESYVQQATGPQQVACHNGGTTCTLTFAAVPSGYRLEIKYVSAEFVIETGPPYVLLDNGAANSAQATLTLPTPTILNSVDNVFYNCFLSTATTFFVEAGKKPTVILASSNNMEIAGVGPFRVTVVGNLEPLASGAVDVQ